MSEVKSPCEECIVGMICTSQTNCDRRKNYIHYMVMKEREKQELNHIRNQSVVDGYFKRFRRSR
jgi:hypothetical protein